MRSTPKNPVKTENIFCGVIRSERTGIVKRRVNSGAAKTSAVASASIVPEKATKDKTIAIMPDVLRMARSRDLFVFRREKTPLNWIKRDKPNKVNVNRTSSSS